jgi:hypothetical protein
MAATKPSSSLAEAEVLPCGSIVISDELIASNPDLAQSQPLQDKRVLNFKGAYAYAPPLQEVEVNQHLAGFDEEHSTMGEIDC